MFGSVLSTEVSEVLLDDAEADDESEELLPEELAPDDSARAGCAIGLPTCEIFSSTLFLVSATTASVLRMKLFKGSSASAGGTFAGVTEGEDLLDKLASNVFVVDGFHAVLFEASAGIACVSFVIATVTGFLATTTLRRTTCVISVGRDPLIPLSSRNLRLRVVGSKGTSGNAACAESEECSGSWGHTRIVRVVICGSFG